MSEVYKIEIEEPMPQEPVITVSDTLPEHVRSLGGNLRERDIDAASKFKIPPHRALWRIYKRSLISKTVFVNGKVVAIFGLGGTFLGKNGNPWFVASPMVEDYPMKLAFRYRSELKNMLKYFPILEDWVDAKDKKTIRLLEILGFKFMEEKMVNDVIFKKAVLEK